MGFEPGTTSRPQGNSLIKSFINNLYYCYYYVIMLRCVADDDEEEYEEEEGGNGNGLLGFMFGNVDGAGDLDIDYLDQVPCHFLFFFLSLCFYLCNIRRCFRFTRAIVCRLVLGLHLFPKPLRVSFIYFYQ